MSKPTLTVVSDVGNQRAATVAGIAAMEFDGVKGFARMPQEKRNANVRGLATRAYHAALVASELCARDKADVIRLVREKYDTFGPALMELAEAAGDTAALLEVIRSGESRLMVALAVIEGEPDWVPPDERGRLGRPFTSDNPPSRNQKSGRQMSAPLTSLQAPPSGPLHQTARIPATVPAGESLPLPAR
jgi:hypothetical protein